MLNWLVIVVAAIVQGVVATIVQAILTNGSTWWVFALGLFIGGILAFTVVIFAKRRKSLETSRPSESQTKLQSSAPTAILKPNQPRVRKLDFTPRTLGELVDEVAGMTEIAADAAASRHIGLWLKVEGNVKSAFRSGFRDKVVSVQLWETMENSTPAVFLDFEASRWASTVGALNVGDRVSAIGRIEEISIKGYVTLRECELVE